MSAARRDRSAVHNPPGTLAIAVAILVGAVAVQTLAALPSRWADGAVAAAAVAGGCAAWRLRAPGWVAWLALALAAFAWTAWRADLAMHARLPRALEKQDILVTGRVVDLPQVGEGATRFEMIIAKARFDGHAVPLRGRVRLSWYASGERVQPDIAACSTWRLRARMKRPHGMLNPGGLDFERSALEKGIVATGYVRNDPANAMLHAGFCVDGARARVARAIVAALPAHAHAARLLRALVIGDQRALDEHDWLVVRATGIPHLIVISGFHVGIAAVFGAWVMRFGWWLIPALGLRFARPLAEASVALPAALVYGALAGFGLPVMRSLVMIAMVVGWRLLRRGGGFGEGFGLALVAILVVDPLAVLSAGFWLSFAGVAFLVWALTARRGWRAVVHELGALPLLMAVGLLPLTAWFFGQASLAGPLANLVAAPLISFVLIPLDLLGACLLMTWPTGGTVLMHGTAWLVDGMWWFLAHVAAWPPAMQYLPETSLAAFALASVGAVWLLMPRGIPARALGALLLLPLAWPRTPVPDRGAFRVTVIDVGQGLSVLVRTRAHALLFDTGARYPSGFDLGEVVVVPTLHALGVRRLDRIIISHGDSDHAGGAVSVLAAYPETPVSGGEPARGPVPMQQCEAGQHWRWDGVEFRVVFPQLPVATRRDNDVGCVVLVTGAGGRALLPADTSSAVEPEIAAAIPAGPPLVLVVPHHGSRTSSSRSYLEALRPTFAIASTGYLNGYHHPSPATVARYRELGIPMLNTPATGAVRVAFPINAQPRVVARERVRQTRYWREPPRNLPRAPAH